MTRIDPNRFRQAALVLVAHGSSVDPKAGEIAYRLAAEFQRDAKFAQVMPAFWKQHPQIIEAVASLNHREIFIVPLLASEGYFSEYRIPQALGFNNLGSQVFSRVQQRAKTTLYYCLPVGTHPMISQVVLERAQTIVAQYPFPRAPLPSETVLFVAGHGTSKNPQSRSAVENHVLELRSKHIYGEVHAIFLEEPPLISQCFEMTALKNIVVVPLFIGEGPHIAEDIPVCLGELRDRTLARIAAGRPVWANPTERKGKRTWLTPSVGSAPALIPVILERVQEMMMKTNAEISGIA